MITPDSPDRQYSTRLRTALVLTGSGTDGAYQAGVLRALHEAGIKIDLAAGRGVGVAGAMFAAMDGGARLWDEKGGLWRTPAARHFYGLRPALHGAGWAMAVAGGVLAIPLALLLIAALVALAGMLLTFVGIESVGSAANALYSRWIERLFAPTALPTVVPRLAVLAIVVAAAIALAGVVATLLPNRTRRRARYGVAGRLFGGPLASTVLTDRCRTELWNLIRGAAALTPPPAAELARRYIELVTENLGQPGFRELLVTVHDMDARRDLVFALLAPNQRARFFARPSADAVRQSEAFDLGGVARDHAIDALAGALAIPVATEPHLVTFAPEGPWRGETHRLCDRPGGLARLLEEVAAAGAEQVIIVSALPPQGRPHELNSERGDLRGHAAEALRAFEAAGLRDVLEQWAGRFAGLFVVRPSHNPLGPLDFGGVYDERSDRTHTLAELVDRGYEDAYRQFIEPVVAASGDRLETVQH